MSVNWVLVAISSIFGIGCMVVKYFIYDKELDEDTTIDGFQLLLMGIDIVKDISFIYIMLYYLLYKI